MDPDRSQGSASGFEFEGRSPCPAQWAYDPWSRVRSPHVCISRRKNVYLISDVVVAQSDSVILEEEPRPQNIVSDGRPPSGSRPAQGSLGCRGRNLGGPTDPGVLSAFLR